MRSIADIYNEIIAEKQNQIALGDLLPSTESYSDLMNAISSGSKVAIWRMMCWVIAVAIWVHEKNMELYINTIQQLAARSIAGTAAWYAVKVKEFQLGYTLTIIDGVAKYANLDDSARIISHCAVVERPDGAVIVKVAKLDSNLLPTPLSPSELLSLQSYIYQIKFAGVRISVTTNPADTLRIYGNVYYTPIIPLADIRLRVESAINLYITNLKFDGTLVINKIIDCVQMIDGVSDFEISSAEAKYGSMPFISINRVYASNAGYFQIDPLNNLASTLTYIPHD